MKVLKSSMTIDFSISSPKIAKWGILSAKFEVFSTYIKLCMNLNLRAEKQNYCLTSLSYVITIVFSISCINAFTICFHKDFVYLITLKLRKMTKKSSWGDESQIGQHCFKKHVLSWEQKRRVKKLFDCKRIWKTQERIKFEFIQEPRIYLFVKSRNSQIFYIINIKNFSNFTQEIYFTCYLPSLYLIQSKLKIFIHSFLSSRLPCPNEWFQVKLFWRKYNEKLHFRI